MMCRMFAYVGSSTRELESLYKALRESASNDTRRIKDNKHGDGWGYVIYSGEVIWYYRSRRAIYDENFTVPQVDGKFYAVFHARQASKKETVSSRFSHPFQESNEKELIFLAHNGYVDEEELKEWLGYQGYTTDSELVTKALAKFGMRPEVMERLREYTVSALNLLILRVDKGSGVGRLYYLNYFKKDPEFYRMYLSQGMEGKAVFSSTLKDYGIDGVPVEEGLRILD
ncbi:MAG: class II glutamine amidotransferase [Metallosphaera yellowstonensis]